MQYLHSSIDCTVITGQNTSVLKVSACKKFQLKTTLTGLLFYMGGLSVIVMYSQCGALGKSIIHPVKPFLGIYCNVLMQCFAMIWFNQCDVLLLLGPFNKALRITQQTLHDAFNWFKQASSCGFMF